MNSITCLDTTVCIEGLEIPAHVGLHALERDVPQKIVIDIRCTLGNVPIAHDDLSHSVDYVPIIEAVRTLAISHKRRLIETLAEEIATVCFSHLRIAVCRVGIRKPRKISNCNFVGVNRVFIRQESTNV